jgi:hypothetical protein
MKLDRSTSFAGSLAAMCLAAAFACGCSATTTSHGAQAANVSNVAGTTNLMSAELAGPAPKVGKAHLAVDEADSDVDTAGLADDSAPKEARRSDGSHRGGGFGTSAK